MSVRTHPGRSRPFALRLWRVDVAAHAVAYRHEIPAATIKLLAGSEVEACEAAVGQLHRSAGVAPWKPYVRESIEYASARPARSPHR